MGIEQVFVISDCKDFILGSNVWTASDDYSLFHFTSERELSQKNIFDGCSFLNLSLNHKTDWGAPIPSTFQIFFKDTMRQLVPPDCVLVLSVDDIYINSFEKEKFIDKFLKPNHYEFGFLQKDIGGKNHSTIYFECPIDKLNILDDIAFSEEGVDVDGLVMVRDSLPLLSDWQTMGNSDVMFRDMLYNANFVFGIWHDHNGMLIATDKFNKEALCKKLVGSALAIEISKYIDRYNK